MDRQVSITLPDYETPPYNSDGESSINFRNPNQFTEFTQLGMRKLKDSAEINEYWFAKESFLEGMKFFGGEINVVAAHAVTGQAREKAFRVFSAAEAAKCGGYSNKKFGWYGSCRDEICSIVAYGFGPRCGEFENGGSCGIGVHLSPLNRPIESAVRAKEDENGLRHILLCRVILGNTETIPVGSKQFQPSSPHFDSGIDNPLAPTKYIIWYPFMNSHISPIRIVSFTAPYLTGVNWNSVQKPSINFTMALNCLYVRVHPSRKPLLANFYIDIRENKIANSERIRRLRNLVGENMFTLVKRYCIDEVRY